MERLLQRTKIERGQIGRIDVGTESMVDMSKSIKSTLTALFTAHGNWSIAGSDLYNACYGGTAALFACVDWVTGCAWDGRYAIAIGSDIARYARGCARFVAVCLEHDAAVLHLADPLEDAVQWRCWLDPMLLWKSMQVSGAERKGEPVESGV